MEKTIGKYAFIFGVILALILGIASGFLSTTVNVWLLSLLVLLGIIVGFLNIAEKEMKDFLMYGTVLIIAAFAGGIGANLGSVAYLGPYFVALFTAVLAFVVPAIIIAVLKAIWKIEKD